MLLFVPFHDSLIMILVLSFLISAITQFFLPAEGATIPKVVPRRLLLPANSLFVFSLYTSFVVGYALAAPVIGWLGEYGPYLLTAAMFTLAAAVLLWLPQEESKTDLEDAVVQAIERTSFWHELREGFKLLRSDRDLAFAMKQMTITQGIVFVILTLAPALSVALLHRPLQHSSHYLIIPAGLGMIAGVVMVSHLTRRWSKFRVLETGLVVAGVALTLLGLSGLLYRTYDGHSIVPIAQIGLIVAVLVFTLGMLNAIISSTAQTMLQEKSSEKTRGKIFGALNMFVNIAATLPILLTGLLADLLSVTKVIMIIGGMVIVFALWQLWGMRRTGGVASAK